MELVLMHSPLHVALGGEGVGGEGPGGDGGGGVDGGDGLNTAVVGQQRLLIEPGHSPRWNLKQQSYIKRGTFLLQILDVFCTQHLYRVSPQTKSVFDSYNAAFPNAFPIFPYVFHFTANVFSTGKQSLAPLELIICLFLWHVEHLSMEWRRVYYIGAIAAPF